MELDSTELTPVVNRLKRAQGQLAAVTRILEEGRGCKDIVTQLAAVSKALDRAGFSIIVSGLVQCVTKEDASMNTKDLEKLFLSLAWAATNRKPNTGGRHCAAYRFRPAV
ncbi:DNA-binding FrmR family transcriptional regulator [Arthrobacter roseus]|nr:DNA-binding FrmR family transcriptional regulator [Arthrobacter roseus]